MVIIMQCPKCNSSFQTEEFRGVTIDRCSGCKGMYLDADKLENLKDEHYSQDKSVDTAYPKDGKNYDKVDDIQCPVCNANMDKISDPEQPHIWMEACPTCNKVFLDAGEINDLRYVTLFDKVLDIFKGSRK